MILFLGYNEQNPVITNKICSKFDQNAFEKLIFKQNSKNYAEKSFFRTYRTLEQVIKSLNAHAFKLLEKHTTFN